MHRSEQFGKQEVPGADFIIPATQVVTQKEYS